MVMDYFFRSNRSIIGALILAMSKSCSATFSKIWHPLCICHITSGFRQSGAGALSIIRRPTKSPRVRTDGLFGWLLTTLRLMILSRGAALLALPQKTFVRRIAGTPILSRIVSMLASKKNSRDTQPQKSAHRFAQFPSLQFSFQSCIESVKKSRNQLFSCIRPRFTYRCGNAQIVLTLEDIIFDGSVFIGFFLQFVLGLTFQYSFDVNHEVIRKPRILSALQSRRHCFNHSRRLSS